MHHVLVAQGVEELGLADDGQAPRVHGVEGADEGAVGGILRVVAVHGHFTADDFALAIVFVAREAGAKDEFDEQVEEFAPVLGGSVDVVDGAIGAGVGVPEAAEGGDAFVEFTAAVFGRALEDHVLDQVRDAGAEVLGFVDGAGAHPDLQGDDGVGGGARAEEGGGAVGADVDLVLHVPSMPQRAAPRKCKAAR